MSNNWILILGANSDIAKATAHRFAKAGNNIYLASRAVNELGKEAANLSIRYGIEVREYYFDATDFKSHAEFYKKLVPKPNGVILCFGFLGDQKKAQEDFKLAESIIDTNYTGAVCILEIIAGDFQTHQKGFIVGISSVAGDRGRASNYIYGSSKAAFTTYLAGLRHRLYKSGVIVTTVKPGFVLTKMTSEIKLPEKLTAHPDIVANVIYKGVQKQKNTLYVKSVWRLIMLIIVHLPEFIFKRTNL